MGHKYSIPGVIPSGRSGSHQYTRVLPLSAQIVRPELVLNGSIYTPAWRYLGKDGTAGTFPADGYGQDLAIAGSGDAPTPDYGSPPIPKYGAIDYAAAKYHKYTTDQTYGNWGASNDVAIELIFQLNDATSKMMITKNTGASLYDGWQVAAINGNALQLSIEDSNTARSIVTTASLTVGDWYHAIVFWDRSETTAANANRWWVRDLSNDGAWQDLTVTVASHDIDGTVDVAANFEIAARSGATQSTFALLLAQAWVDALHPGGASNLAAWEACAKGRTVF